VIRASLLVVLAVLTLSTATGGGVEDAVLAIVSGGTTSELVGLDPRSLEPVPGTPRVPLGLQDLPWARSPDGSMLAVGSGRSTSIVFVDVRSMRRVGRVATAFTTALAWPRADRLVLLERGARRWRFALVDPTTRTVLSRRGLGARRDVSAAALTRDGLAVLMTTRDRIAAPRLLVLDDGGRARRVSLPGIAAGSVRKEVGARLHLWYRYPGLAVDAERDRAYVVTAGTSVAEIDLVTLAVSYRDVRFVRARSLGEASVGTVSTPGSGGNAVSAGTQRQAYWLGNGLIAKAGWNERLVRDDAGRASSVDAPAGLALIDTRTWAARWLSRETRWFHATPDSIVAEIPPRRLPGTALVGFTHEGSERFKVELRGVWAGVQSAGDHVYLGLGAAYRPHPVEVLDARTGERIGAPQAPGWVLLLSSSQPQFCWCYTGTTVG